MGQKARVEKLERVSGKDDRPFAVDWGKGDGLLVVNGVEMTREEFEARFPNGDICRVVYES